MAVHSKTTTNAAFTKNAHGTMVWRHGLFAIAGSHFVVQFRIHFCKDIQPTFDLFNNSLEKAYKMHNEQ